MSKHTKGPWEIVESTTEQPFPCGCPVAIQQAGTGDARGRICEMIAQGPANEDGSYNQEASWATARLIAAAPDMLEALRKSSEALRIAINWILAHGTDTAFPTELEKDLRAAQAALDKAKQ